MQKFIDIVKWIVKLPVFWMPASWKGYRRTIITALIALCVFLQGLDLVNIADGICSAYSAIFGGDCNLQTLAGAITMYVSLLYEALKNESDSSVFTIFKKSDNE